LREKHNNTACKKGGVVFRRDYFLAAFLVLRLAVFRLAGAAFLAFLTVFVAFFAVFFFVALRAIVKFSCRVKTAV